MYQYIAEIFSHKNYTLLICFFIYVTLHISPLPKKQITFKIQDRNAHILFYFHSYDDIFGGHKKRQFFM